MVSGSERTVRAIATTAGWLLVALGGSKLNSPDALEPLRRLLLPEWSFSWIARGEILVGLLLIPVGLRRIGGLALSGWMLFAAAAHIRVGDPLVLVPAGLGLLGTWIWRASSPPRDMNLSALRAPLLDLPQGQSASLLFVFRQISLAFLLRWAVGGIVFWLALPALALCHAQARSPGDRSKLLRASLLYFLFYGFGVGGIWNFVGHVFMSDMVAASVGWAAGTGFQQELGFYALGTGVVGLLTPWIRDRFWIAAAVAPSIFVYGAALTHIEDYLSTGNDAPMNWGVAAVGANLVIPTIVLIVLWRYARAGGFETR